MSKDYTLKYNLSSYEALDKFALLADQKYNLGDKDDWFNNFRGGLFGLYSRLLGVCIHFKIVHSWDFSIKTPTTVEYHISSIFFNMDSAIECMVFALNALGYIADSSKFLDISDEKKLRNISPNNLLLEKNFVEGYNVFFPSLKKYWLNNRDFLFLIFEQHDVSKHRSTIYKGGKVRNDPPSGFLEILGINDDKLLQTNYPPMAEILIYPQLKIPARKRSAVKREDIHRLEDIAEKFCEFIDLSGAKAIEDAKANIKLNYIEFKKEEKQISE
jgi:hypothetical protein